MPRARCRLHLSCFDSGAFSTVLIILEKKRHLTDGKWMSKLKDKFGNEIKFVIDALENRIK